mmetsp:Transcript_26413/g.73968  ORF Transcript_26413/g.73968 Transcript_26413/m.73968 type:complete len:82 (-) Transcript_26413:131-376(-)|eukprot:scaffold205737_cov39-Tisochrysis_lutea.AAC.2
MQLRVVGGGLRHQFGYASRCKVQRNGEVFDSTTSPHFDSGTGVLDPSPSPPGIPTPRHHGNLKAEVPFVHAADVGRDRWFA